VARNAECAACHPKTRLQCAAASPSVEPRIQFAYNLNQGFGDTLGSSLAGMTAKRLPKRLFRRLQLISKRGNKGEGSRKPLLRAESLEPSWFASQISTRGLAGIGLAFTRTRVSTGRAVCCRLDGLVEGFGAQAGTLSCRTSRSSTLLLTCGDFGCVVGRLVCSLLCM
jgi:hypothetical protein